MGTHADDLIEREEFVTSTFTASIPKAKSVRACPCGADMEQYWNVGTFSFEWYCEECDRSEDI